MFVCGRWLGARERVDALLDPLKKLQPEVVLQLANLARHRALRQVQLFSRPRDAGVPGSRLKGQQVGNRRQKGLAEHGGAALGLMLIGNELAARRVHRFGALALSIRAQATPEFVPHFAVLHSDRV